MGGAGHKAATKEAGARRFDPEFWRYKQGGADLRQASISEGAGRLAAGLSGVECFTTFISLGMLIKEVNLL